MRKLKAILATAVLSAGFAVDRRDGAGDQGADPLSRAANRSARSSRSGCPTTSCSTMETLPAYHEPDWVSELVKAGKLPPVEQRLPKEPLIVDTSMTADGVGQYGGTLRHVIGARPQGWNWIAGQYQGYGGTEHSTMMCLVRTGPMWMLTPEKVEPLPQLAKSWDWSDDGKQLTMHLVEGAKWSDGAPFTSEDVIFSWEDNIVDPSVPGMGQGRRVRRGHQARGDRRQHHPLDLHGFLPGHDRLSDGAREFLPGTGAYPEAAASQVQQERDLRFLHQRAEAGDAAGGDDGAVGPGRLQAGRDHHHAAQPVFHRGRRPGQPAALPRRDLVQAVDLGRPHDPDGRRHRRLHQHGGSEPLSGIAEEGGRTELPEQPLLERALALVARRLQPVDGLRRGQRCRQGQARALPQARLPPRRDTGRRPRRHGAGAGEGAVRGAVRRRPACRDRLLQAGERRLLSL